MAEVTTASATLSNQLFVAEACSVQQIPCNGTLWLWKETTQQSQAASCRLSQTSLAPVLFSWLLLSSLPQKRQDLWATALIALPPPTYLMGSSYGQDWLTSCCPRHSSGSGLTVMTSFVTNNDYFSPPHSSASGTTDMKKLVFSMQNWSSRLKFEWSIQKHGTLIYHTKGSNTLWQTAMLPNPHNRNVMCSFQLGKEEKSFT